MSYDVATRVNTSSNQAIKDPGQRRCSYSNLGKIVIQSGLLNVWLRRLWLREILPENSASRHRPTRAKSGLCETVPLSVTVDAFITVPVSLIPTYSILPLFNFVEAGISTRVDNLS